MRNMILTSMVYYTIIMSRNWPDIYSSDVRDIAYKGRTIGRV
jgi:hypothetical protein